MIFQEEVRVFNYTDRIFGCFGVENLVFIFLRKEQVLWENTEKTSGSERTVDGKRD